MKQAFKRAFNQASSVFGIAMLMLLLFSFIAPSWLNFSSLGIRCWLLIYFVCVFVGNYYREYKRNKSDSKSK